MYIDETKINNLLNYFINKNIKSIKSIKSIISKKIIEKTIEITEDDFKQKISDFEEYKWINHIDILIMSIDKVEKLQNQLDLSNCNKLSILWIMCIISIKYLSGHDHQNRVSLEHLANLGGFQIKDYIYFERVFLKQLDWRLEMSNEDYNKLCNIANRP